MIRLNRAGRKQAIVNAIRMMNSQRKNVAYTKGEICRKMGITSQSKIRDVLNEMVREGILMSGKSAIDGYADELVIYQIAKYEQRLLPTIEETVETKINFVHYGKVMA